MKKRLFNKKHAAGSRIIQGGLCQQTTRLPDVVLQMPEIFLFNMASYMAAIKSAKSIDYANRAKLYDLYESCLLDLHLAAVIDKRLQGVTRIPITFLRDNKPDDEVIELIDAPWFRAFIKDAVRSLLFGFTLVQFYLDEEGKIAYESIDRRHFDPIRQELLKYQFDASGVPVSEFPGTLFIGEKRALGIMAELVPAVLYKRGNVSDWAQFCNIFGMPIREYTYEAGDEDTRRRLIADAKRQGANAVYIHPKESDLTLREAGNKTGSSDLYKNFTDYWDTQMSIRVLGNSLTTDSKQTGTQALGKVHKEEEDDIIFSDRQYLLDVLNYQLKPVLQQLGFEVENGKFAYKNHEDFDASKHIAIVKQLYDMGLPISDDYLYETFKIEKPGNYNQLLADKEERRKEMQKQLEQAEKKENKEDSDNDNEPSNADKTTLKNRLKRFFGLAPTPGANSDW